jgi:membrane fusion protein (multidrug efflux system)
VNHHRFMFSGFLLLTIGLCTSCASEKDKPAPPPPGVAVGTVVQKDVPITQEWIGTMVGNVDADIRPKVEGFLLKRLYTEGSYVRKGQPMFQLDPRQTLASVEQAQGQLERANAALAQAHIDVKRYTPLVAEKAVSQAELDKARSMERAATAGCRQLKRCWITRSSTRLGQRFLLLSQESPGSQGWRW